MSAIDISNVPNELSGSRRPGRRWSNTSTVTIDAARNVLCANSVEDVDGEDEQSDSHVKVFIPKRIQGFPDRAARKLLHTIHRHNNERVREPEQVSLRQSACAED